MSAATYVTAQIMRMLPRARIGHAVGELAEWPWPAAVGKAVVGLYSRAYRVQLGEYDVSRRWASFDDFFTRPLPDGARAIDPDPKVVASPADGTILCAGAVDSGGTFDVKGRPYSVAELVGSVEEPRFRGGSGFVVYLSPRDYHRVHAPVTGRIHRIRSIPGDYFPVNAIGMAHVPSLFCRNRRVAIELDAEAGLGRVTVVMVAAMIVGRITTIGSSERDLPAGDHAFDPPLRVRRGEEIGVFHLGSTAVVLSEGRGSVRWFAREGQVRVGQAVLAAAQDLPARELDGAMPEGHP
jgi:phosphatidylserine decarboxylase